MRTSLLLLAAAVVLCTNAPDESRGHSGVNAQYTAYPASNVWKES